MPVSLLHLISTAGVYGAEQMVLTLIRGLSNRDCRVRLGIFHNTHVPEGGLTALARGRGIDVESIRCHGRLDPFTVGRIRQIIRDHRVEVVHTHGFKGDLYGYAAARTAGVPVVATCHNWTDRTRALALYAKLDRCALRRFDGVAAVSDTVADRLRESGVEAQKLRVIQNGVELPRAEPLQPARSGLVIGMAGRLVKDKGFHDVIAAAPSILKAYPEARFVVAGDGPDADELRRQAAGLGIGEQVTFLGFCANMASVYAAMDIFVLPSYREAMPMTVLEAMAVGKPVIATRVGAIPEMLGEVDQDEQEARGILVQPGNREELTKAIGRLLAEGPLRVRLARNGQSLVRKLYSGDAMAGSYLDFYHSVLGNTDRVPVPLQAEGGNLR